MGIFSNFWHCWITLWFSALLYFGTVVLPPVFHLSSGWITSKTFKCDTKVQATFHFDSSFYGKHLSELKKVLGFWWYMCYCTEHKNYCHLSRWDNFSCEHDALGNLGRFFKNSLLDKLISGEVSREVERNDKPMFELMGSFTPIRSGIRWLL